MIKRCNRVKKVRVLAVAVAVSADHVDESVFPLVFLVPVVRAVERVGVLQLAQQHLVVFHDLGHVPNAHAPVEGVVRARLVRLLLAALLQVDLQHLLEQQPVLQLDLVLLL